MHISSIRSLAAHALVISMPVLSVTATLAGDAAADDRGPTPATSRAYQHLLDRFDANHDGRVQTSELPAELQRSLGPADTDHDGRITPEELHHYGVERRAARFARADKNADGKLEASEVGAGKWEYLKVADGDGDGKVTLEEIERAVASGRLKGVSTEEVVEHG
jgi:Ca2+-binding EF-hand superfamily protein